jgi:hypothetical protein
MPSNASRRTILAACTAIATSTVGGCLEALTGRSESDSSRKLTLRLSHRDGSLRERHVVDLDETRIPWDEAAFAAALDGESYTTTTRKPFFASDRPKYVKHDGTYYELGSVVVNEATHVHPVLRLETVGRTSEMNSVPDHVSRSELPEEDRQAVHVAYMAARARGNEGGVPWGLVERGGYVYRNEDAVENSRLLGDSGPSHVEYRDRIYAVEVTREEFREPVYRATVEPVAENETAVETILRARLVDAYVDRGDLSAEAQSVLRKARRDGGYAESHPYSAPFETVLRELDRRAYLDGNVESDAGVAPNERRLVRYDGRYFDYRLEFGEADA